VKEQKDAIVEIYRDSVPWRSNPNAKDSAWIMQRKKFEAMKGKDATEVLLHDGNYKVSEGLVTNIFGFQKDGKMYTAPSLIILEGFESIKKKEKIKQAGIEIIEEPLDFSIENLDEWEAIFLCSNQCSLFWSLIFGL
jgi:branched-subunit amino acid aminotransferase/4-amino-4-deoxychorismate lyase